MFRTPVTLIILVGVSSAFLYNDMRCHEGPSYWCSSPDVAEACQATSFCEKNVWGPSSTQEQSNNDNVENFVTCKACTIAFSEIKKYAFNEKNEEGVISALSKLCDRIPESMTNQCKTFINTYGKEALDELEKTLSPSFVCTAIGMCDTASHEFVLLGQASEATCNTCKSMTAEVSAELAELMKWWSNHCDEAEDSDYCREVSEFSAIAVKEIFSEELCQEMQMC